MAEKTHDEEPRNEQPEDDFIFSEGASPDITGNKTSVISLRIEPAVLKETKAVAAELGIKYQALMRQWIHEGLKRALGKKHRGKMEIQLLMDLVQGMSKDLEEIKDAVLASEIEDRGTEE